MNLRDLQYVIAVAETRHFGKAASRCFVSQPTLSGQIKKLEDELGVAIFERSSRNVEITPVGEAILEHARQIMEQSELIHEIAQAHTDPMAGSLSIGAIPTLSPYLLPLILLPLKQQYPQMRLVWSEELTETLLERLRNHQIDAALLATEVEEPDMQTMNLFDEPFWLAHPGQHPFYNKDKITQADLDAADLLLLSEGHCLAKQVMQVCKVEQRKTDAAMPDLRASSLETLLQLVSAGYGCTLVPALAVQSSRTIGGGVIVRELELKDARRRISLVFRKSYPRRAALEAFARVVLGNLTNTVYPMTGEKPGR